MRFSYQGEISTVMSWQGLHQVFRYISWDHPQLNPLGFQFFQPYIAIEIDTNRGNCWALIS